MSHCRSSERVMSHCRSSERVMSHCRSSERVMSHCRSREHVISHCRSSECVMSHCRRSERVMSHCRSSERVMSHCRRSERVMSLCRSGERVMSHCRSGERVMSHFRSSERVMSHCRSSERVMSHCRSSERVMSHCRSSERLMSHCRSSERVMSHCRSSERVTLGDWHELRLSRTGRLAILEVDDLPATQTMTPGAFTQLSLPQNLYIGGVPNFDMVSPKVSIRTSFVGCIQKVVINNQPLQILAGALGGVNVDNCPHPCVARPCGERGHCVPQLDYFTCSCGPGFDDPQCQQHAAPVLLDDIPVPRFTGDSFLHYSDPDTIRRIVSFRLNINMRFRTSSQAGLMLWSGRRNMTSSSDFLALGLAQGVLHFRFNLGSGEVDIPYNCTGVSDGLWHRVKAVRNEQEGSLVVDNGPVVTKRAPGHLRQLNTNTGLYIGGMDNIKHSSMDKYAGGLVGCISDLILDTDYHVKLVQMSTAGRNIKHCG